MISHNPDTNCTNARLYYYDFLNKETREGIPEGALQHIKQCRNCHIEMDRLKDLLVKADEKLDSKQSRKDSAISTLLRLHFEYIGQTVKCNTVKPFLASLADPSLQIRIPTPITIHLDKCQSCRDDLLILRDLHLPHKYLCRLGQLLADQPIEDNSICSRAQAAVPAVVSLDFHETNAEILKHLCICLNCRKKLYLHRERVRKELLQDVALQDGFPCESVTAADIYDYCLPYGIDPADDQYVEFREPLTSHLRRCPTCLAKMQELHLTIYNIAERAESDVITTYNIFESAGTQSPELSEPYAGLPINVEIQDSEDGVYTGQPASNIAPAAVMKKKTRALNLKPLFKAGLAAAAVIAIGLALLFNAPEAKAVTIEQICRALENAKNVYIATFTDKMELKQERWVSRSLNIYLSKTEKESALLNIPNRVSIVTNLDTGIIKHLPLSAEMINESEKLMTGFLGLVPFNDISLLPNDIEWNYLVNDDLETTTKDIEIYELAWLEKAFDGSVICNKWRFFVDSKTHLPKKTESYRKFAGETEYALLSVMEIQYLSDSTMVDIVKKTSF